MEMVLGPERSTETAHVGQLVGLSGEGAMKSQSRGIHGDFRPKKLGEVASEWGRMGSTAVIEIGQ